MWPNLQETADLVTFTEEILMGNFIFCIAWLLHHTEAVARKCYMKNVALTKLNVPVSNFLKRKTPT